MEPENTKSQPEEIEYVDPNGTRGILVGNPSPESWEQFVRVLLDIKSKYGIQ